MTKSRTQLEADGAQTLRAIAATERTDRARRGTLIRDLAETLVSLRAHFTTNDGSPDWLGRTWAYKDAIIEMYHTAGYTQKQWQAVGSAVRWHVGNVIRERLTTEELEDLGLLETSPLERERARNVTRDEAVRILQRPIEGRDDTLRALMYAVSTLEKVPADQLTAMSQKERRLAREALGRIIKCAEELHGHV